ncbi:hypothetical protein HYALB_00010402 [Hymenoscyphus albidus]|uniref:Xylanolytic transcriptional activator regulatory domain-containing protein n=1 Tax=Hymenoscyphus albidus TaxID=595503 RepID=A0A9N9LPY9_9HELO|nr:hypothetical protein HYALB_00010402 [Hymenoscyphus albidus]
MTPTPPSTTSSSAGGNSPDGQYRVVRKRNRLPLSCGPCRHRKLKCNRSHPCENCGLVSSMRGSIMLTFPSVRRGDASSCSYAAPGSRKKNQSQGATTPDDMQNRIDRLEGLVLSLMTNGSQSAGPAAAAAAISRSQSDSAGSTGHPLELELEDGDMIKEEDEGEHSEVEGVTNSLGLLKVDQDKGKELYFGDSHWHSVLKDINEVKQYFATHKKELESNMEKIQKSKPTSDDKSPAFLFNSHGPITDGDLRGEVPTKSAVDRLVTRYFNSYDPAVHILHSPTFHKQLQDHWEDPAKTSILWLGLLYSVLCLAMQSYNKIGDEPMEWKGRTRELAAEYRLRTVQCLVNSDYTKSSINTIETLVLYVHGEYANGADSELGMWVVVGIIVRLAMRMGYHRDPGSFAGISPYQAEMRRRVWAFVRQMDTMYSFQLSLPGMIRNSDCDCALPRNIFEDEFGPDSKALPPARPFTEPTPISYMIIKAQISFEFGSILEEINAVQGSPMSYEEILKRDTRLRELKDNMPPHLRLRPLEECMHDPATLLMQRFNLDIFWQKTLCVLHRKHLMRARHNPRYAYSRRVCVEAAMEVLRHQAKLYQESQHSGRMRAMRWFISFLTKNDYMLAAMVVCVDQYYDRIAESMPVRPSGHDLYFWTPSQKAEMLSSLEKSQQIWAESAETSMDAYKASNVLKVLLDNVRIPSGIDATAAPQGIPHFNEDSMRPEHSAAMTLGMLSGGLTPNSTAFLGPVSQSSGGTRYPNLDTNMAESTGTGLTPAFQIENPFASMNNLDAPFSSMFNTSTTGAGFMDLPANLDWGAWDSFMQNGGTIDPAFSFYPTNMDSDISPGADKQQQQGDPNQFGNGVFMGANTPGR